MVLREGLLIDRRKLVRRLGEGGQAPVWLVKNVDLRREEAAKLVVVPFRDDDDSKEKLNRIKREAQQASKIGDDNVVLIYDYFDHLERIDDEIQYAVVGFFMQYLKDGNFNDPAIVKRVTSDTGILLDVCQRMCLGLDAVHRAGIVHHDVKPENFLVSIREGKVFPKLSDFGAANSADDASGRMGSLSWMAPERFTRQMLIGDEAKKSDIYSLGLILYFLATGKMPYADFSIERALDRNAWDFWSNIHCEKELDWRNFSDEREKLKPIVRAMTAKNAAERPTLARCISGLSVLLSKYSFKVGPTSRIPTASFPRGRYVWHPSVHKHFKHTRKLHLIRSRVFVSAFHSIKDAIFASLDGGVGVYAVLGQRDIVLTEWGSAEDDGLQKLLGKLAGDNTIFNPESITLDEEALYVSGVEGRKEPSEKEIVEFVLALRKADSLDAREAISEKAEGLWIRKISESHDDLMAFVVFRWPQALINGFGVLYLGETIKVCSKFTGSFIAGLSEDRRAMLLQIRISDYNKVGPLILELHHLYNGKKSVPEFRQFTSETFIDLLQDQRHVSEDGYLSRKILHDFGAGK